MAEAFSLGKRQAAAMLGTKLNRTNWGKGKELERMTRAVSDWDAKTGEHLEAEQNMLLTRYAGLVGIPYDTFRQYCCEDKSKRKELGTSAGKKPLFDGEQQQFAVDVLRRCDRGNDGKNRRECVDMMHDMRPDLKRKAVQQAFDRTVRPAHKDELTGIIKANATTVKRTAITVPQQYRWHTVSAAAHLRTPPSIAHCTARAAPASHRLSLPLAFLQSVDQALALLREMNTGLTPDGKTFGEVIDHFWLGGDETCFLASNGEIKIIGDKEKPKHDLPTGSSRTSATVYRLGSAAGATGPTGFLPPGKTLANHIPNPTQP